MKNIPTDFALLKEIYKRHLNDFENYSSIKSNRSTKTYVPVDIIKIAEHFKVDPDLIFGRLYSYFNEEYGYVDKNGGNRPFFEKALGGDKNVVNFPQLATVIAKMREENSIKNRSFRISVAAIIISLLSLAINFYKSVLGAQ